VKWGFVVCLGILTVIHIYTTTKYLGVYSFFPYVEINQIYFVYLRQYGYIIFILLAIVFRLSKPVYPFPALRKEASNFSHYTLLTHLTTRRHNAEIQNINRF
jgi:hypothetical protein